MSEHTPHKRRDCESAHQRLMDYFDGELRDSAALGELESHVSLCTGCQEDLSALRELRQKVQTLPRPAAPERLKAQVMAGAQAAAATASMSPLTPISPSMTRPGPRPAPPVRRRVKREVNVRRLAMRGLIAAAAMIMLAGVVIGARHVMEQRSAKRYAAAQAFFMPNVEYYNSTHYFYDLGDVRAADPLTIEKWYGQPGPRERLGFHPVLPRWSGGQVERAYVCVIRERPAAIVWYDWGGVKVALHVQQRHEAMTPYLANLRQDMFDQAVTAAGLTMVAWRAADLDYVLVAPEAQARFVFSQVF